jgi:bacterioferritin
MKEFIMKGDQKVLDYLNKVLTNELTAISQFFLHARMYKNWGFYELNDHEYAASIDKMKDADRLIERILFLEGLPNLQDLGKLMIGENVPEMIEADLQLEKDIAMPSLNEAIAYCESCGDYISRELFEGILSGGQGRIDWLETQMELIDKIGLQNYQQSQL